MAASLVPSGVGEATLKHRCEGLCASVGQACPPTTGGAGSGHTMTRWCPRPLGLTELVLRDGCSPDLTPAARTPSPTGHFRLVRKAGGLV